MRTEFQIEWMHGWVQSVAPGRAVDVWCVAKLRAKLVIEVRAATSRMILVPGDAVAVLGDRFELCDTFSPAAVTNFTSLNFVSG